MEKEIEIKSEREQINEEFKKVWETLELLMNSNESMKRQMKIIVKQLLKLLEVIEITKKHKTDIRELTKRIKQLEKQND